MGLGGIARDSIADLASLVHDDNGKGEGGGSMRDLVSLSSSFEDRGQLGSGSLAFAESSGGVDGSGGTFLFLGDEDALQQQCCVGLNDGDGRFEEADPIDVHASSASSAASIHDASSSRAESAAGMYYQFQYEGFTDYYAEDFSPYNYDYDGYSSGFRGTDGIPFMQRKENRNIFCCFFAPWMNSKNNNQQQQQEQPLQEQNLDQRDQQAADPEQLLLQQTETGHAESQSQQAVIENEMARGCASCQKPNDVAAGITSTRLERSDLSAGQDNAGISDDDSCVKSLAVSVTSGTEEQSQATKSDAEPPRGPPLLNNDENHSKQADIRSILKVKRCTNRSTNNGTASNSSNKIDQKQPSSASAKRHLFPAYEPKNSALSKRGEGGREERSVAFNPMARVLTIPSRKDIPLSQKVQVWWQKSDYDDFKKTGRIISKAMECGGSEIWLTSTNAWGKGQQSRDAATTTKQETDNEMSVGKETDFDSDYAKALEKYTGREKKSNGNVSADNNSDFGNKWWCKFGHSRRGLEHIVSSSEGKARQQSVLLAIEMVLEEQKRQRVARTKDPNKLRNVAMQYTSWARDLALAAGAADAEAVESNFDLGAKSRAHHFAKRSTHLLSENNIAGGGVAIAITSQILDENTHGRRSSVLGPLHGSKDSHLEHDTADNSLSKRAKGFIPGENLDVSASQIMSGMGNLAPRAALKT
eukprot:CCRYP_015393-RA/>CCRYP_015393-RA protein AED:0.09 eAED:0.09 QI:340/1/1/1/1/1/4/438/699